MVRTDISQWLVEPPTALGSLGVKVTRHEIVFPGVTYVDVLLVLAIPLTSVIGPNVVFKPIASQLPFSYREKVTVPVPFVVPSDSFTVAVSFGNQFWAVVVVDVSFTLKHSLLESVNRPGLS